MYWAMMETRRNFASLSFFPQAKLDSHLHIMVPMALSVLPSPQLLSILRDPYETQSSLSHISWFSQVMCDHFYIKPPTAPYLRWWSLCTVLPFLLLYFPSLEGVLLYYYLSSIALSTILLPENMLIVYLWVETELIQLIEFNWEIEYLASRLLYCTFMP